MSKTTDYQWRDSILAEQSGQKMRFFRLDKNLFFKEFLSGRKNEYIQTAMQDLIKRYDIRGKKILSIGPGDCEQEFWFSSDDNSLLLVDIDEGGAIEPGLVKIASQTSETTQGSITYAIGDARRLNDYLVEPFDVLLSFSFTPDEYYRSRVQDENKSPDRNFNWPVGTETFSPILCEMFKQLPDGAVFISLSYCGGPDALSPTYLSALHETLKNHDMKLLEVYALKSSSGVHLVVAQKGLGFQSLIPTDHPLSTIHPRASVGEKPITLFSVRDVRPLDDASAPETITYEILARNFKKGQNCIYEGYLPAEINAFVKAGLNTRVVTNKNSLNSVQLFPNAGELSFIDSKNFEGLKPCHLLWSGNILRDNNFRKENIKKLSTKIETHQNILLSEDTHSLLTVSQPEIFMAYGQAAVNIRNNSAFRIQLNNELSRHGFSINTMWALRASSKVFMIVACKMNDVDTRLEVDRFYPEAVDVTANKIFDIHNPNEKAAFSINLLDIKIFFKKLKVKFCAQWPQKNRFK